MASPSTEPWSQTTKDRWFFGFLVVATVATVRVFWPFFTGALFAAVVVAVAWPLHQWVTRRLRAHQAIAATATMGMLGVVVFVPLTLFLWVFVRQCMRVADQAMEQVQQGRLRTMVDRALATLDYESLRLRLPDFLQNALPSHLDLTATVVPPLQSAASDLLGFTAASVPGLMNSALGVAVDGLIFLALTFTLLMEGPALLQMLRRLSPMDDRYDNALFQVFGQIARNLVVGSLGTSAVMALVAWLGYFLAGLDDAVFFAVLTGIFSFVPFVGTSVVWIPLAAVAGAQQGWWTGVFVFGWSILFTAQVDTLVRPVFMGDGLSVHPLAVLLSILGGVAWLGPPGVLVGPMIIAMFLALYTIYRTQYLGLPDAVPAQPRPSRLAALARRWAAVVMSKRPTPAP